MLRTALVPSSKKALILAGGRALVACRPIDINSSTEDAAKVKGRENSISSPFSLSAIHSRQFDNVVPPPVVEPKDPAMAPPSDRFYTLAMFPYPSGDIHLGHVRVYVINDVIARAQRMQGKEVLNPLGWDSFGLPAENAARERGVDPETWTNKNIGTMKQTLESLGLSVDWERELRTSDPEYYKWTQWIFTQMHDRGFAEQRDGMVKWDPVDETVLANEQVDGDGRSWRSGALAEDRNLRQWYVKTTKFADDLVDDLSFLQSWPKSVVKQQEQWIGRTNGTILSFGVVDPSSAVVTPTTPQGSAVTSAGGAVNSSGGGSSSTQGVVIAPISPGQPQIDVFTTRPDTIYGATFIAVSPEHPMLQDLVTPERRVVVAEYVADYELKKAAGEDMTRVTDLEIPVPPKRTPSPPLSSSSTVTAKAVKRAEAFHNDPHDPMTAVGDSRIPEHGGVGGAAPAQWPVSYLGTETRGCGVVSRLPALTEPGSREVSGIPGMPRSHSRAHIHESEASRTPGSKISLQKGSHPSAVDMGLAKGNGQPVRGSSEVDSLVEAGVLSSLGEGSTSSTTDPFMAHRAAQSTDAPINDPMVAAAVAYATSFPFGSPAQSSAVARYEGTAAEPFVASAVKSQGDHSYHEDFHSPHNPVAVDTGARVRHPTTGELLPVMVADYVMSGVGTAALMGVPQHDKRDFAVALRTGLPHKAVVERPQPGSNPEIEFSELEMEVGANNPDVNTPKYLGSDDHGGRRKSDVSGTDHVPHPYPYSGPGKLVRSGPFSGMNSGHAGAAITRVLGEGGVAKPHSSYRLRDWLVSRQRFWGTPIPIVHCSSGCGAVSVPTEDLPVKLPAYADLDFSKTPDLNGKEIPAPLNYAPDEWLKCACPKCGGEGHRETDTLDTFVDSSWYFLRFADPHNSKAAFNPSLVNRWNPVDVYVGGVEHAILHLMYARFVNKFLHSTGDVGAREPFGRLLAQGMVTGATYKDPESGKYLKTGEGEVQWRERAGDSDDASSSKGSKNTPKILPHTVPTDGSSPMECTVTHEKMSKSKYNGVAPGPLIEEHGADVMRLAVLFKAPAAEELLWDESAVAGQARFLQKVRRLVETHVLAQERAMATAVREGQGAGASPAFLAPEDSQEWDMKMGEAVDEEELKIGEGEWLREVPGEVFEREEFNPETGDTAMPPAVWGGKGVFTKATEAFSRIITGAGKLEFVSKKAEGAAGEVLGEDLLKLTKTTFPVGPQRGEKATPTNSERNSMRATHVAIAAVEEGLMKRYSFNTSISELHKLTNALSDKKVDVGSGVHHHNLRSLLLLMQPFAPHTSTELWERMRDTPLSLAQEMGELEVAEAKRSVSRGGKGLSSGSGAKSQWTGDSKKAAKPASSGGSSPPLRDFPHPHLWAGNPAKPLMDQRFPQSSEVAVSQDAPECKVMVNGKLLTLFRASPAGQKRQDALTAEARRIPAVQAALSMKNVTKVISKPKANIINFIVKEGKPSW